jgi:hypothetical protein
MELFKIDGLSENQFAAAREDNCKQCGPLKFIYCTKNASLQSPAAVRNTSQTQIYVK